MYKRVSTRWQSKPKMSKAEQDKIHPVFLKQHTWISRCLYRDVIVNWADEIRASNARFYVTLRFDGIVTRKEAKSTFGNFLESLDKRWLGQGWRKSPNRTFAIGILTGSTGHTSIECLMTLPKKMEKYPLAHINRVLKKYWEEKSAGRAQAKPMYYIDYPGKYDIETRVLFDMGARFIYPAECGKRSDFTRAFSKHLRIKKMQPTHLSPSDQGR